MTEWLDVVNGEDRVISVGTREEIHRLKLRHRTVHLFIFNQEGLVFLQQRASTISDFPNCFGPSVSGHLNSGESYFNAIVRECFEELGIKTNDSLKAVGKLSAAEHNGWEFSLVFVMRHDAPFKPNKTEVGGGEWCDYKKIIKKQKSNQYVFFPGFDEIIRMGLRV